MNYHSGSLFIVDRKVERLHEYKLVHLKITPTSYSKIIYGSTFPLRENVQIHLAIQLYDTNPLPQAIKCVVCRFIEYTEAMTSQ